jgi:hypothetical protein
MNLFPKNYLFSFFVFSTSVITRLYPFGAMDNVVSFAVNHADDMARAVIINADDIVQTSLLHADDVMRIGVVHADDIVRLSAVHADDIARLGLRNGDNLIYDFSRIHIRAHTLLNAVDNVDDIALKGMSRASFVNKYGKTLADDFYSYSGGQSRYIQAALEGKPIVPQKGYGRVGHKKLKGDDYIKAVTQRGNRLNDFLNTQMINKPTKLLRGGNLQPDSLSKLYNIGDVNGKNVQAVADMIKKSKGTFNPTTLSSASLPSVSDHSLHSFAINGWGDANIGKANPYKIIREFEAPSGTKGFNMSQLSSARGQQEFLMPKGLRTNVTDVRIENVVFEGKQYDVIRVFETIIP